MDRIFSTRRDALAGGVALALASLADSTSAKTMGNGRATTVLRVYAGEGGQAQFERVALRNPSKNMPGASVTLAPFAKGVEERHVAPAKIMTVTIAGRMSIELPDGRKADLAPGDIGYFEDLTGSGHIARFQTSGAVLVIQCPADFDFMTWVNS